MRLTTPQYMLVLAAIVSVIMSWVSAADHNGTCIVFLAEMIMSMWLLHGSLHKKKVPEAEDYTV